MGFLSNFRADSLIVKIRTLANPAHPEAQAALAKLVKLGPSAIPKIVEALATADK